MVPPVSFSTGLGLEQRTCARKAHNVGNNGGAEACVLERTSGAASLTTLVTLRTLRPLLGVWDPLIPDLILRPRKPLLDFGELQQPV